MKTILIAVMLLATPWSARADVFARPMTADALAKTLLAQPAKEIARARVLRGVFEHAKYLREIPAPLRSTGEFVFLRERGLYWHTRQPFDSVFVLTPSGMAQQDEGGSALKMDANEQPAVRAAAGIFMALFAVDLNALDKEFLLFGEPDGAGWRLGLKPKNSALGSVFKQAIVSGVTQVREIELQDAHGDRTIIRLKDTQLSEHAPTPQELALLSIP